MWLLMAAGIINWRIRICEHHFFTHHLIWSERNVTSQCQAYHHHLHISHSVTIWESCWAQKCDPCCLWMSGDELKHNGIKLAQLPIWGIQRVWCANTIVSITSLTVSSCPDVFMDPQRSSAKYNQCKIASEQNHLTVFRLITGEAWMYWHGSMFQSTASWQSSPLSWSPMSGLTSEVITQVLGEWIGLERRNSSQPVTGTSS